MPSRRIPLILGCWLLAASVAAQTEAGRPNFSGIWKMDPESSQFGPAAAPQSAQYTIRHLHATLTFDYTQDANTTRVEITPDNEERMTDEVGEMQTWTRAHWEGGELVLEARQKYRQPREGAPPVRWTSRWSLSPDRKVLTIRRRILTPSGPFEQVLVFRKQRPATQVSGQ